MWLRLEKSEASQPPIPLKKTKGQISGSKSRNKQNTNRLKKPPGPYYHCGKWHWMKFCPVKKKKYNKNCNKKGHNLTQCWYSNIMRKHKSKIRQAQSDERVNRNLRKYVTVDIFSDSIKFQLDSGFDITIISWRTWRKLNKPTLLKTDKTAKSVTGENMNILGEVILTVTLNGVTKKLKAYVLKNSVNLFGTDWIEKFNLWDGPMSTFCRKIESTTPDSVNLKKELKQRFPQVFSDGLGKFSKLKTKIKVKDGAQLVFKKKRNVPFAALEKINKELDKQTGILSKTDFSEWAAPTVHVKKKSNQLRICANFSTGLNDTLQDHHYPLPSPEEIFTKLNIKNMQNLRGPLSELLKKDKPWLWTPECQESFEKIKKTLTSDLSLTHNDPTLGIIVASDASSYGIGACILHKLPDRSRKAVAHASRSLLSAEKQYSQIEKEALGIIFIVTKFHRYLHGRLFILQTDHRPLITIFGPKKGLPVYIANRLLRWGTTTSRSSS